MSIKNPVCPYCNKDSKLAGGSEIYPHRRDLHALNFYLCRQCDAYVGTHKGTTKALGRLANKELRKAKTKTHKSFDPIWQDGFMKRQEAYVWLAKVLNISLDECHIGMFDIDTCHRASLESIKKQISFY